MYEKVRWYKRKDFKGEMDAAKVLLDELETALDMDNIVNRAVYRNSKITGKANDKKMLIINGDLQN